MVLTKLLNNNIRANIIGSTITEYDLSAAHPTALYLINGNKAQYDRLMDLPKLERNITIGKMIKKNPDLRKQIDAKILELFNEFIKANNILEENFLATTPDSILITNRIATVMRFQDIAYFRNKEKISYSSLFYINRTTFILFDRLTKRMRIKGLGDEKKTRNYPFVKKILTDLCCVLDDSQRLGYIPCLRRLKQIRINYIYNEDINVFRDIKNNNMFKYIVDGRTIYSEVKLKEDDGCILVKSDNYMNFILSLIQDFI